MAKPADFYPLILPTVLGAPYPTVDLAINRAAAELCESARVWEEFLDPITLRPGVAAYPLDLPAGSILVCARSIELDGVPLALSQTIPRTAATQGMPVLAYIRAGELMVSPAPDTPGGVLTVFVTLRPSITATQLPDVLLDRHMVTVAEGAKAFLKEMTGAAWFDPAGYSLARQTFLYNVSRARIAVEHGFVGGSLAVAPRAFGSTR